ncbi:hypothetical protein [Streptomyces sp. VRA16 Mangrove soil]|uniref:hypothetical protein n=1 Tax=Streptomyces sp. VRA16 Mangrove soil TaxID=2817434 RepID=UPI001A9FD580|nr:hypothetical protein [Streptomyces sp. VRA16 Mangrove soil]MBO1336036.1 hypothetical protein [Streptomyces sp. VRA16 Mangrove soil]
MGPQTLKKGAGDLLEVLEPVKKVDLEEPGKAGDDLGDEDAAKALSTFCATWEMGAGFLNDCAAELASGLNSADKDLDATDQAIRDAVNSVKTDLG